MKKLYIIAILLISMAFTKSVNAANEISVTATAGTLGPTTYSSLTGAAGVFAAINAGTHRGVITITVTASESAETGATVLNASGTGSSVYTNIYIYTTGTYAVSGAVSGSSLIAFNGADNVLIDGRVGQNGTTIALTFTNTAATSSSNVFRFYGDATSNTIKYCNIKGDNSSTSTTSSLAGLINFCSESSATANSNNKILNNTITKNSAQYAVAIMLNGTTNASSNIQIKDNNIVDFSSYGIWSNSLTDSLTILRNSFYQSTAFAPSATDIYAVNINSGSNHTVNGNFIGGQGATCTGATPYTLNSSAKSLYAISFSNVTAGSIACNGNTIQNIAVTTTSSGNLNLPTTASAGFCGIFSASTVTSVCTFGTSGSANTIGSTSSSSSISVIINNGATAYTYGILLQSTASGCSMSYNNIGGLAYSGTSTLLKVYTLFYYVTSGGSSTAAIDYNTIGDPVNTGNTTLSAAGTFYGIYAYRYATSISHNTIQSITSSNTGTGSFYGIYLSTGPGTDISYNTIGSTTANNISLANNGLINGIQVNGTGAAHTCSNNTIQNFNITGTSTGNIFYGIYLWATDANCYNNTISNITSASTNLNTDGSLVGIYSKFYTATESCYSNTISNLSLTNNGATVNFLIGIYTYFGGNYYNNTMTGFSNLSTSATAVISGFQQDALCSYTTAFYNNIFICNNGGNGNSPIIAGIYWNYTSISTSNFYYNTIKIYGTATSGTANSYCFYDASTSSSTHTIENNIFQNLRTNSGASGKHYAEFYNAPGGTKTTNYNYLEGSQSANVGNWLGSDYTYANFIAAGQANAGHDQNGTITILSSGKSSTSAPISGNAVTGTGISTDITGVSRSGSTPTIGAYETASSTSYTWAGGASGAWTTITNWTPNGIPGVGDLVTFNTPATIVVTGVPTISALYGFTVTSNTSVTLRNTTNDVTLSIGDGAGTDLTVASGSTLILDYNTAHKVDMTLVASSAATISGTLQVNGSTTNVGPTYTSTGTTTVASGGTYIHARDGGTIPTCTWNSASNMQVTGMYGTVLVGGIGQTFGNVTWNCANQTVAQAVGASVSWTSLTMTASNSGSLCLGNGASAYTLTLGSYSQTGGSFYITGGSATANQILTVTGNFTLATGGTFDINKLAATNYSGRLNVAGNFTHAATTLTCTRNSTTYGFIYLNGTSGTQTLESPGSTNAFAWSVAASNAQCVISATKTFVLSSGATFTIGNGTSAPDMDVSGTFTNSSGDITKTGTITIESGGIYTHGYDAGNLLAATWASGSTCNVTGIAGVLPGQIFTTTNTFANFIWNCASQSSNIDWSAGTSTSTFHCNGNFTLTSTNGHTMYFDQSTSSGTCAFTIGGDCAFNGGTFVFTGYWCVPTVTVSGNMSIGGGTVYGCNYSASSGQQVIFNITGNFTSTSGTFYCNGYNGGGSSGYATLNIQGSVDLTGGTCGANIESHITSSSTFNLTGTGNNTLKLPTSLTYNTRAAWNWTVSSGRTVTLQTNVEIGKTCDFTNSGTLIMGTYILPAVASATATFTNANGATLKTGHSEGITTTATGAHGSIQVAGTRTFNAGGIYEYNGTAAQATGNGLPATITGTGTLVINNTETLTAVNTGVSLSQATTVSTGTVTLTTGILTTASNLLTITNTSTSAISNGSIATYVNGPLKWTMSDVSGDTYIYPTGKGGVYYPLTISSHTSTSQAPTVEAFAASPGGDGSSLSNSEYWKVIYSNNAMTAGIIKLQRTAALSGLNEVGYCTTAFNGTYTSLDGNPSGTSITANNSVGTVTNTTVYYAMMGGGTHYYWIGGTGNWSSTAHWSATSGGLTCGSTPSSTCRVYFDANSGGGTATVDATGNTLDLNFTGYTGTLSGSNALNVYGSITMVSGMTNSYTGTLTFASTSTGRTVTTGTKSFGGPVVFNGSG